MLKINCRRSLLKISESKHVLNHILNLATKYLINDTKCVRSGTIYDIRYTIYTIYHIPYAIYYILYTIYYIYTIKLPPKYRQPAQITSPAALKLR